MTAYTATFERRELKYRVDSVQLASLLGVLAENMEPDAYGKTLVSSMYFDTPRRDLIGRSVEHPLYKEKVRLRRYGSSILLDKEPCFVELKKKYAGIVYKRRTMMSGNAAALFLGGRGYVESNLLFPLAEQSTATRLDNGFHASRELQTASELEAFVKRSGALVPSMLIECQRTAWQLPQGSPYAASELRITIDENLGYRDLMELPARTRPSNGQKNTPLIARGEAVLEIKALDAMPRWLVDALDLARIRPASFTKYGSAYAQVVRTVA